jgi:small redox-active disulfide protein 2
MGQKGHDMTITVYGARCAKCRKLADNAAWAAREAGVEAEVVRVESAAEIAQAGVVFAPGLAIDGELMSTGAVVPVERIVEWIKAAA